MYLITNAKKLDFMWKMLRRELGELGGYEHGPCKISETLVRSAPLLSVTPESQGLSSEEIINFYRELSDFKGFKPHSAVIMKNGMVVSKTAWKPYSTGIRHVTHSMAKSIISLAIGIAEGEGLLTLDEKICDIFPKHFSLISSKRIRDVRIVHLLTMSTGARFFEADTIFEEDWVKGFIEGDLKWNPGEKFEYNSINTYLLSALLTKKTGVSVTEYLKTRLFEPMGIRDVLWERSPMGREKGGWGLYMGTEEMAKFGQLCLNKGAWIVNGKAVQLVPAGYIERATVSRGFDTGDDFGYGYQFWTMDNGYMMNGMFGQYVIVYPEQNIVIALNSGSDNMFSDPEVIRLTDKYFVNNKARKLLPLNRLALNRLRKLETSLEYGVKISADGSAKADNYDAKAARKKFEALDGKVYEIEAPSVSILPVIMQCMQGNFTEGINKLAFRYENDALHVDFVCDKETFTIKVGQNEAINSLLEMHGEKFLIAVKGQMKQDEDDRDVLKIMIYFTEMTSTRLIKVVFCEDDEIIIKMSETPVISQLFSEYITRNDDMFPKNIIETMNDEKEIVELLLDRLSEPRLRGKIVE
ncbi:MAG: serine hydrolase [Ruminococcaceae bacterium]|nr:serine hydrolase [Oscillospiraceae bacterium]